MNSSSGTTDDFVVDIPDVWLRSVEDRLRRSTRGGDIGEQRPSIFRVPPHLRENDENAYEPRLVSVGPCHRGKERLKAMEERKWHYLRKQLEKNQGRSLKDYLKEMKKLETRARSCYSEKIEMSSDEFAEMLLLDGSFVLQFLMMARLNQRDGLDPIAGTNWFSVSAFHDMILLENQLPLFIIRKLYNLATNTEESGNEFSSLVLSFFGRFQEMEITIPESDDTSGFHHLLHLYHSCIITTNPTAHGTRLDASYLMKVSFPNAVKLHQKGISFKRKEKQQISCVTFRDGVVKMPPLVIFDNTVPCFRNLIAFEQCNPDLGLNITNYASFLECLVIGAEDVALLKKEGVLLNCLGSEEAAAQFLSQLCKHVLVSTESSHLRDLFIQLNQYYKYSWLRWKKKLANRISSMNFLAVILALNMFCTTFGCYGFQTAPQGQ